MRSTPAHVPARRRAPVQARGHRRTNEILEAAAGLLAEVGYDALTLTEVAQRSGSSIGSLYRFFADKQQLIGAVMERLRAEIRAVPETVLTPHLATLPPEDVARAIVEPVAAVAGRHPEIAEIFSLFRRRSTAFEAEIAERLGAIVRMRAPGLPDDERTIVVATIMSLVRGGVLLLATAPQSTRRRLVDELQVALAAYVRARLGEGAALGGQ